LENNDYSERQQQQKHGNLNANAARNLTLNDVRYWKDN